MHSRRAFTLLEMAVLLFGGSIAGTLLIPAVHQARRSAQHSVCAANLGMICRGVNSYAADYKEVIAALNWKTGAIPDTEFPDLRKVYSPGEAGEAALVAAQAADIIRRHTGRSVEPPQGAHVMGSFHHLMLTDYWAVNLPNRSAACPTDDILGAWIKDPAHFNQKGIPSPIAPAQPPTPSQECWAYVSSYTMTPSAWTPNRADMNQPSWRFDGAWKFARSGRDGAPGTAVRRMHDVWQPSSKALYHDNADRHFASKPLWWGVPDARVLIGLYDGSVQTKTTREANPGCDPRTPERGSPPFAYDYAPEAWMPGGGPGARPIRIDAARYATTRMGLFGVDFSGPEVFPEQAR